MPATIHLWFFQLAVFALSWFVFRSWKSFHVFHYVPWMYDNDIVVNAIPDVIRFWINCPLCQGLLENVLLGWTKEKDSLRGLVCSQKGTNRRGKCEPAFVAELRKNQVACLTEVGSCFVLAHTFRCLFAMKDVLSSVKLFSIQTNSLPLCFIQIDFKMCQECQFEFYKTWVRKFLARHGPAQGAFHADSLTSDPRWVVQRGRIGDKMRTSIQLAPIRHIDILILVLKCWCIMVLEYRSWILKYWRHTNETSWKYCCKMDVVPLQPQGCKSIEGILLHGHPYFISEAKCERHSLLLSFLVMT